MTHNLTRFSFDGLGLLWRSQQNKSDGWRHHKFRAGRAVADTQPWEQINIKLIMGLSPSLLQMYYFTKILLL